MNERSESNDSQNEASERVIPTDKKIVLFGSQGLLGKEFKRQLFKLGTVNVFSDRNSLDLSDFALVEKFITTENPDIIINCSAYTDVNNAEKIDIGLNYLVNSEVVKCLGIASRNSNAHLIHFSTDYVFDGTDNKEINEEKIPKPLNEYGKAKLKGEKQLQTQTEKHTIVRLSWLYGPNSDNLVYKLLCKLCTHLSIHCVSNEISAPTYAKFFVNDMLVAISEILNDPDNTDWRGVFHYSHKGQCSVYELATELKRQLQERTQGPIGTIEPVLAEELNTTILRPKFSKLENSKFREVFRGQNRSWQEALNDYLDQLDLPITGENQ